MQEGFAESTIEATIWLMRYQPGKLQEWLSQHPPGKVLAAIARERMAKRVSK